MENEFITVEQAAKQIQDYLEGRAEMPKWAAHLNLGVSPRTPKIETVFKNTGEQTPEPEINKSAGYLVGGQTVDNLPWKNVPKNRPTYPIPDHKKAMERYDHKEEKKIDYNDPNFGAWYIGEDGKPKKAID